jgi:hypothetical protein
MAIVIALVLGVLALAFVLYPLYRHAPVQLASEVPGMDEQRHTQNIMPASGEATEREQAARSAIQEVELDYQLGNIADADYQELRERYMRRALAALKTRYDREQEIDAEIEEQLRRMKETQQS